MTDREDAPEGFADFFRRYAKTWVHAVAVAAMTAFGTLTVVHRWFAVLSLVAYAAPPIALYLSGAKRPTGDAAPGADEPTASPKEPDETGGADRDGPANGTAPDGPSGEAAAWTSADVPVESALFDVAVTPGAACAVGSDGVVLLDGGDGWSVALEDGPGADSRTLRGVDATADGSALWIAGDGGALARVDAETGRHTDFSAPEDVTDAWTDVAVGGESGAETVLLVNGSGELLRGRYRGGEVAWSPPEKPGGGSSLTGADLAGSAGYLCDSNDGVFATDDGGETFRRVGLDGADGTLTDVVAVDADRCLVADDDGVLHRFDGARWTPERLDDRALWAVARREGYAVAAADDGAVHEREEAVGEWERVATPTTDPLRGVAVGEDRAVAVGTDGAVVERQR